MNILSRKDAKLLDLKRYFTGEPCVHGHVAERFTRNATCVVCHKKRWASRGAYNPIVNRRKSKKWKSKNPDKVYQDRKDYYARKRQATPPWVTRSMRSEMRNFKSKAIVAAQQTGVKHHVDHIVPLKGETVCGLNVPWNLQVLPAQEALSKANKLKDS